MIKIPFWVWLAGAIAALVILGSMAVLFRHSFNVTAPHKSDSRPAMGRVTPTQSDKASPSVATDAPSTRALNQITPVPTPYKPEASQPELSSSDVTDTGVQDKPLTAARGTSNSTLPSVAQNGAVPQIQPSPARALETSVNTPTPAVEPAPSSQPEPQRSPEKGPSTSVMIPLPSRK